MAANVKSPSDIANPTGLANFLGPPKLLGRDDKLATLVIKVDEGNPHLKICLLYTSRAGADGCSRAATPR